MDVPILGWAFKRVGDTNVTARLEAEAEPARVTRWEAASGPYYDVGIAGFETLSEANDGALALRAQGCDPEIVVLPLEAH